MVSIPHLSSWPSDSKFLLHLRMYNTPWITISIVFPSRFLTLTLMVPIPFANIVLLFAVLITKCVELIFTNRFLLLVMYLNMPELIIHGLLVSPVFRSEERRVGNGFIFL